MKTALSLTLLLSIVALTFAGLAVMGSLQRDLDDLGQVIEQSQQAVTDVRASFIATSIAETAHWQAAERELLKTLAHANDAIVHTDLSLNGRPSHPGLATTAGAAIALTATDADRTFAHLEAAVDQITASTDVTMEAFGHAADSASAQLQNPQVTELLGHLNVTALHLEGVAANSAAMSGDMRIAIHRLAAPPTKFHEFLDASWTVLRFGSLFATP